MEWLLQIANNIALQGPNAVLSVAIYKGLRYFLDPFKPLFNAWLEEQLQDYKANKEKQRLLNNKLEMLKFAVDLAKNEKGSFPETISTHCNNLLQIARFTSEYLSDNDVLNEDLNDDEWVERFFQEAQFVSDETLQKLWARLMKEKVCRPSSVNKKVLYILRDLSKDDLDFVGDTMRYFDINSIPVPVLMKFGSLKSDILRLAGIGLVLPIEVSSEKRIEITENNADYYIQLKGHKMHLNKVGNKTSFVYNAYSLTQEGVVMYNIIEKELSFDEANVYLNFYKNLFMGNFEVTLEEA